MNPRAEAFERLGGRYEVRVLEPSPPAVREPPWFADDPVARGEVPVGRRLVSPVGSGDLRWEQVAGATLSDWCAERWLGPYRTLSKLPPRFAVTRNALHQVAERLMKPARENANGKFGLRFTRGGFGTPFFGDDAQVRVEHGELVVQIGVSERRVHIASMRGAADLLGSLLPADIAFEEAPLEIDRASATALGDWFGFATSVLEELRAEAQPALDPSRVQILARALRHRDRARPRGRRRARQLRLLPRRRDIQSRISTSTPWTASPGGELWNATAFPAPSSRYAELLAAEDQRAAALDFFTTRRGL